MEGPLILRFVLGIVEVFTTSDHIDALVFPGPRELSQSLVLFVIGDEICIKHGVQFLGYAVLGRIEYDLEVLT